MAKIALSQVIQELRREIEQAIQKGKDEEVRFGLGEVTIEAEVEVSREGGGEGKVSFWLAEIGASGKASKTRTQKISLTLKPRTADGTEIEMNR